MEERITGCKEEAGFFHRVSTVPPGCGKRACYDMGTLSFITRPVAPRETVDKEEQLTRSIFQAREFLLGFPRKSDLDRGYECLSSPTGDGQSPQEVR